jgi:hypothetical protein
MKRFSSILVAASLLASGVALAAGVDSGRTDNGASATAVAGRPTNVTVATFAGNWTATTPAGTQTGRANRNGVPSSCNGAVLPGPLFDATVYQSTQSAHTFVNPYAQATCFTFTLTPSDAATCGFNLQPNLYLGTFNPADPNQNRIGTRGLSTGFGPASTVTFDALVPGGGTAVYVINNTNAIDQAAVACGYSVAVSTMVDLPVPTLSSAWLASLALMLAIAGFFGYRRYAAMR